MDALIEDGEVVLVSVAFAHAVQDREQRLVLLPEDLAEFDQRRAGWLAQCGDAEEERTAVGRLQVLGDLAVVDDRGQLMQVAEQGEAHAAERLARASAI